MDALGSFQTEQGDFLLQNLSMFPSRGAEMGVASGREGVWELNWS